MTSIRSAAFPFILATAFALGGCVSKEKYESLQQENAGLRTENMRLTDASLFLSGELLDTDREVATLERQHPGESVSCRFLIEAVVVQNSKGEERIRHFRTVRAVNALLNPDGSLQLLLSRVIKSQAAIDISHNAHHGGLNFRLLRQFKLDAFGATIQQFPRGNILTSGFTWI